MRDPHIEQGSAEAGGTVRSVRTFELVFMRSTMAEPTDSGPVGASVGLCVRVARRHERPTPGAAAVQRTG